MKALQVMPEKKSIGIAKQVRFWEKITIAGVCTSIGLTAATAFESITSQKSWPNEKNARTKTFAIFSLASIVATFMVSVKMAIKDRELQAAKENQKELTNTVEEASAQKEYLNRSSNNHWQQLYQREVEDRTAVQDSSLNI